MFDRALDRFPQHARSIVGRAAAFQQLGRRAEVAAELDRAARAIEELRANGRLAEAALTTSFLHVVAGDPDAAIAVLDALLRQAPAGYAGWTIPIEPLLRPLHGKPGFAEVLARLVRRAG